MSTAETRAALEAAHNDAPTDAATRLVLADLYEEAGAWERATWHRLTAAGNPVSEGGAWEVLVGAAPSPVLIAEHRGGECVWAWWAWHRQGQGPWREVRDGRLIACYTAPPDEVRAAVEATGFEALRLLGNPAH